MKKGKPSFSKIRCSRKTKKVQRNLTAKHIKAIELLPMAEIVTYWRSLCGERAEHK
jgi:hypothetical protein